MTELDKHHMQSEDWQEAVLQQNDVSTGPRPDKPRRQSEWTVHHWVIGALLAALCDHVWQHLPTFELMSPPDRATSSLQWALPQSSSLITSRDMQLQVLSFLLSVNSNV